MADEAESLLVRTDALLARMETNFKQLLPDQLLSLNSNGEILESPRPLEFDKVKKSHITQIRQEIDDIKAMTARLDRKTSVPVKAQEQKDRTPLPQTTNVMEKTLLSSGDEQKAANAINVPRKRTGTTTEVQEPVNRQQPLTTASSNVRGKTSDSDDDDFRGANKTRRVSIRKGRTRRLTEDLLQKISHIEKQIAELQVAKQPHKRVTLDGIDVDSSTNPSGSPVKALRRKILSMESIPQLELASIPSSSPVKFNTVQRRTFTVQQGGDRNLAVATERIMDEGFRTARQIKDKLALLKGKAKSRDAASQVSIRHKDNIKYSKQFIENLEKKVETLVRDCRHCHHPAHNTALHRIDAPSRSPKPPKQLVTQKLPSVNIPGSLTTHLLPGVDISPMVNPPPSKTNATIAIFEHGREPSIADLCERSDSLESLLREVVAMQLDNRPLTPEIKIREDIAVQTSSRHSGRSNVATLDDKLELLTRKFQNRIIKKKDTDELLSDAFSDLVNQVSESKEKCQKYRRKKISYVRNLIADNVGEPKLTPVVAHGTVQSSLRSSKEIGSLGNDGGDDYESDFEVESLQLDEPKQLSARSQGAVSDFVDKLEDMALPQIPISSERIVSPRLPNLESGKAEQADLIGISQHSSIVIPSDGSLIEEHMKKLGLSPRKSTRVIERYRTNRHRESDLLPPDLSSSENAAIDIVEPAERTLYIKSNGQYIPVDPLKAPLVNIIVPEIVVKLPDAPSTQLEPALPSKLDQVVQTDEGCGTLTSGDTTSVVEKINGHFERTQLLLERLENRPSSLQRRRRKQRSLLDNLHVREGYGSESSSSSCIRITSSGHSLGEVGSRPPDDQFTANQLKHVRRQQRWYLERKDEDENSSPSIGEVLSSDYR